MASVFFSYSHRDEEYRNELEIHLAMLKRQGIISTWHDRRIGAGREIDAAISKNLESASIVLLLVSPYFLASEYCYDKEMTRAVIVHPCDWQHAPFGRLRATPLDGKPISKFSNLHEATRRSQMTSGKPLPGSTSHIQRLLPLLLHPQRSPGLRHVSGAAT